MVSVLLLQDHFYNNDFLEIRVRIVGSLGYTKGEFRVLWEELGFGEIVLEKRSGVDPYLLPRNSGS